MARKKKYYSKKSKSGSMISSDYSAMANLPQSVKMAYYPSIGYAMSEGLNDTIVGQDKQIKADMRHQKKGAFPEKY